MTRITQGTYGTMYYVKDMKKTVSYYKILGLTPRYESNEWTEFDIGDGSGLCLHAIDGEKAPTAGGVLIMKVNSIKTLVPELQKAGIEFQRGIHEVHPGAFSADFFDPSGNMVSLYEDTNKR